MTTRNPILNRLYVKRSLAKTKSTAHGLAQLRLRNLRSKLKARGLSILALQELLAAQECCCAFCGDPLGDKVIVQATGVVCRRNLCRDRRQGTRRVKYVRKTPIPVETDEEPTNEISISSEWLE